MRSQQYKPFVCCNLDFVAPDLKLNLDHMILASRFSQIGMFPNVGINSSLISHNAYELHQYM